MVARTAYTQLNYSPLLLILTLVGMTLIYIVPPLGIILGALMGNWGIAFTGLLTWLLMSLAYLPTIRFYKCPVWLVFCLSAIAFLYTLMTLDECARVIGKGKGVQGLDECIRDKLIKYFTEHPRMGVIFWDAPSL